MNIILKIAPYFLNAVGFYLLGMRPFFGVLAMEFAILLILWSESRGRTKS